MIRRGFVDTPNGQIHYREEGIGKPVILLHQTPRSSDEFVDVIPLLAANKFRAIAMDTIGFGDSYKPSDTLSIAKFEKSVILLADQLDLRKFSVVGHHTGAVIAFELAYAYSERIEKMVLSSCPYTNRLRQRRKIGRMDKIDLQENGHHLNVLWNERKRFYPKHRPDLLNRYLIDALKAGKFGAEGHQIVR